MPRGWFMIVMPALLCLLYYDMVVIWYITIWYDSDCNDDIDTTVFIWLYNFDYEDSIVWLWLFWLQHGFYPCDITYFIYPDAPWCWNMYLQNWVIFAVSMWVSIPAPWSIWEYYGYDMIWLYILIMITTMIDND